MFDKSAQLHASKSPNQIDELAELSICSRQDQYTHQHHDLTSSRLLQQRLIKDDYPVQKSNTKQQFNQPLQQMSDISMIVTGGIQYARFLTQQQTLIYDLIDQYQRNLQTLTKQTEQLLQHSQLQIIAFEKTRIIQQIRDVTQQISGLKKISSCQLITKKDNTYLNMYYQKNTKAQRDLKEKVKFQRRLFNKQKLQIEELDNRLNKMSNKKRLQSERKSHGGNVRSSAVKKIRKGSILRREIQNQYHSMTKIKSGRKQNGNFMDIEDQYGINSFPSRMKTKSKYSLENQPQSARKQLLLKRRQLLKESLQFSSQIIKTRQRQLKNQNDYLSDELLCIEQQINRSQINWKIQCSPSTEAQFKQNKSEPYLIKYRSENLKSIAEKSRKKRLKISSPMLRQNSNSNNKLRIKSAYEIEQSVYGKAKPPRSLSRIAREPTSSNILGGKKSNNEREVIREYFQVKNRPRGKLIIHQDPYSCQRT